MISYMCIINGPTRKSLLFKPESRDPAFKPHKELIKDHLLNVAKQEVFRFDTGELSFIQVLSKQNYLVIFTEVIENPQKRKDLYKIIEELKTKAEYVANLKNDSSVKTLMKQKINSFNTPSATEEPASSGIIQNLTAEQNSVFWEDKLAKAPLLKLKETKEKNVESFFTFDLGDDPTGIGRKIKFAIIGAFAFIALMLLVFFLKTILKRSK